ncbi:hypothetical protein CVT26_003506 [Gymnopilus dilepis]|uniref:DUF6534 domain-containing protein n=1 Tax=Gymnopilus dilepis TaxID=231916 RepID=A0A409W329_9AGAR|nr:hypothetical protein CVT26_003506 [Gymnopilus dilepis]
MDPPTMDETYGAMYIGLLFAVFFQGVLTVQAYIYYENFPQDPQRIKLVVAAVWMTDLAHLILISSAGYHYFIRSWGDNAALLISVEPLNLHLTFIGLASIICQVFFLHRVWLLSNRQTVLVAILGAGCMTTFAFDIGMSVVFSRAPMVTTFTKYVPEVLALFSSSAFIDLVIAALLVYYLNKGRGGIPRSNSIIDRIMQYTVATGLATSLLAFACVIAYVVRPMSFIYIAMHFSLGRLYTNALLASLNARRNLRANTVNVTPLAAIARPRVFSTVLSEPTNMHDLSVYEIEVNTTEDKRKDVLFAVFFQGVLTVQAYNYYENFPQDPRRIKFIVAAVWLTDLVHLVLISSAGYHYFISNWGNDAALGISVQALNLHLAFIGLASIICQVFFLHRVWLLSNRQTLLVALLGIGCLTTFSFDIGMSVVFSKHPIIGTFMKYTPQILALFSSSAFVDLVIAGLLVYYLRLGRGRAPRSNFIIDRIIQYTVATGLATR